MAIQFEGYTNEKTNKRMDGSSGEHTFFMIQRFSGHAKAVWFALISSDIAFGVLIKPVFSFLGFLTSCVYLCDYKENKKL